MKRSGFYFLFLSFLLLGCEKGSSDKVIPYIILGNAVPEYMDYFPLNQDSMLESSRYHAQVYPMDINNDHATDLEIHFYFAYSHFSNSMDFYIVTKNDYEVFCDSTGNALRFNRGDTICLTGNYFFFSDTVNVYTSNNSYGFVEQPNGSYKQESRHRSSGYWGEADNHFLVVKTMMNHVGWIRLEKINGASYTIHDYAISNKPLLE